MSELWRRHVAWRFLSWQRARDRLNAAQWRVQTEYALAAGLCIKCRRLPVVLGQKHCEGCGAKRSTKAKDRYHQRIADGLCGKCGDVRGREGALCESCMTKQRERERAKRERLRQAKAAEAATN